MGKTREKIVLIGPVYPYKGGISHYTGLMYRALCKVYDVTVVSYAFQYPKLLYKREQKDYSNDSFKIDEARYLIHTANPLNWLNTAKEINKCSYDCGCSSSFFESDRTAEFTEYVKKEAYCFSWERMVEVVEEMLAERNMEMRQSLDRQTGVINNIYPVQDMLLSCA